MAHRRNSLPHRRIRHQRLPSPPPRDPPALHPSRRESRVSPTPRQRLCLFCARPPPPRQRAPSHHASPEPATWVLQHARMGRTHQRPTPNRHHHSILIQLDLLQPPSHGCASKRARNYRFSRPLALGRLHNGHTRRLDGHASISQSHDGDCACRRDEAIC